MCVCVGGGLSQLSSLCAHTSHQSETDNAITREQYVEVGEDKG